ncbi:uroporphyrinogen decarboxylase family protein [candidate division KSB1 bacterium]|nr:uroporphyrinogen decarboxylase family protein [candidate division KSB1 bacterium]
MNSNERFRSRLRGAPVDRPPNFNIMMTFAAHYIGQPLSRYYLDHRVLCEANLAVQRHFKLDIVQAISDPYREAADLGANIIFPEDELPICVTPLINDPVQIKNLEAVPPSAGRRMSDRIEAIRRLKQLVGSEIPVMGWIEGALAEAAVLRGVNWLLQDLYDRPDWVLELLEFCAAIEIAFARAQVEAGADIIGLGDAVASQISPVMYAKYALPFEQKIFAAVHEVGALCRLHICGDTTNILHSMPETGADIIDIDWMVNMAQATRIFGAGPAVCGNFDPVAIMLRGTPTDVQDAVKACLRAGGNRCIIAAGCEIPDKTPSENLAAQTEALLKFKNPPEL